MNPCYKCEERAMGCHSRCEKYKAWKAWWDEAQKERRRQEEGIQSVINSELDMHYKMLRRKR